MLVFKAGDGGNVVRLSIARAKPGMTFCTCRIRRRLKQHGALVFDVACRACGSEGLIGMVQRRVVARETSFVGHMRSELASLRNVAKPALLREYGMCPRKLAARIDLLTALSALRDKPSKCEQRDRH